MFVTFNRVMEPVLVPDSEGILAMHSGILRIKKSEDTDMYSLVFNRKGVSYASTREGEYSPTDRFIDKFIKDYNKGDSIQKVTVQYGYNVTNDYKILTPIIVLNHAGHIIIGKYDLNTELQFLEFIKWMGVTFDQKDMFDKAETIVDAWGGY